MSMNQSGFIILMIGYEIKYFSFLIIAVLFSAGNAKKNVFTVFIDPIVTIDVFIATPKMKLTVKVSKLTSNRMWVRIEKKKITSESVYCDDRIYENCENVFFHISCAK